MGVLGIFMSVSDAPNASRSTNGIHFDATVSDFAWHGVSTGSLGSIYSFMHPPAAGDITWYHFALKIDIQGSADDGYFHDVVTEGGAVIVRLDLLDGQFRIQAIGTTTVYSPLTHVPLTLTRFDMKVDLTGSSLVVSLYFDGGVEPTLISTVPTSNGIKPGGFKVQINDSDDIYTSELYVADFDTRNTRPVKQTPDATGNHSAWTGGFSELGDEVVGTAAEGAANGDKVSVNIEGYPGPTSLGGVNRVVLKIVGSHGVSGPQNLDPFLRIGGVDYSAGNLNLTLGTIAMYAEFDINPATSLPWGSADMDTTEIGLEAKT